MPEIPVSENAFSSVTPAQRIKSELTLPFQASHNVASTTLSPNIFAAIPSVASLLAFAHIVKAGRRQASVSPLPGK